MSDFKRWQVLGNDNYQAKDDGFWVKYHEVEKLEARCKELDKKAEMLFSVQGVLQRAANRWNDGDINERLADMLEDALF